MWAFTVYIEQLFKNKYGKDFPHVTQPLGPPSDASDATPGQA